MSKVTKVAGLNRESAYKAVSKNRNPTIKSLVALLKVSDLRFTISPSEPVTKRTRKSQKQAA